jgi:hypothetical protein
MRKIKIIEFDCHYDDNIDEYVRNIITKSEWEEVDEEKYQTLRKYFTDYNIKDRFAMVSYQESDSVNHFENVFKDIINKKKLEDEKREKIKLAQEKKREEESLKRKKKNAEKREVKLLKELEELKRIKEEK